MSRALKKLFYPNKAVVIVSIAFTFLLIMLKFGVGIKEPMFTGVAYVISIYSLIIACTRIFKILSLEFNKLVNNNRYVNQYVHDIAFRTKISLYQSFTINFIYAAFKFATGIYYKSIWLISLSIYYVLLASMRLSLLRHARKEELGDNLVLEYRKYRKCGIILLFLDIVLTGLIVLIVHQDNGFVYPGYFIYVMAIYTFCATISAIINLQKYRKEGSPVISASKVINLMVALISMLSLEVAMLAQFGGTENVELKKGIISITGAAVCVVNSIMAVYMIVKANGYLYNNKLQAGSEGDINIE